MKRWFFVLGSADPEMAAIEYILRKHGYPFGYAVVADRSRPRRVRPFEAYRAEAVMIPDEIDMPDDPVRVFVECRIEGMEGQVVDHHRPGDPGFGAPPEKAFEASSLGQVIKILGLPEDIQVKVQGMMWPARVVAASDHCLTHAYQGQVPGVSPFDVVLYRNHIRAKFLRMSPGEYGEMVERAKRAIFQAPEIMLGIKDLRQLYRSQGPVQEAQEAAARMGVAILYELPKGDRIQVGLIGATPEQVRYFKEVFAPEEGLQDVYGDPARGFAGGFKS